MTRKIEQVKESVEICKLNIENQERHLEAANIKIALIQNKMTDTSSLPSKELENLINIYNKLKTYANLQKGIILEFKGELNSYELKLQQLSSNSICGIYKLLSDEAKIL